VTHDRDDAEHDVVAPHRDDEETVDFEGTHGTA
jgi:hypothetical protein